MITADTRVLALSGGVGGAKLAAGLARRLRGDELTVVCNSGDDFDHLGLRVCPDLDSVVYALADLHDPERGWGRRDEGWRFMESLDELGGETWFRLGDRDLAMHVERTRRLAAGGRLTEVTAVLAGALGVSATVAPMSDDPVATVVDTADGELAFQHYFVRERCAPAVRGFRFAGADRARPHPELLRAPADPGCRGVVLCPSNPFVSLDPILALPGVEDALRRRRVPAIAVTPIVGGRALKGPTAKMMGELGLDASAAEVARHYARRGLIDGFVLDRVDGALEPEITALGLEVVTTDTVMTTPTRGTELAAEIVGWLDRG